MMTIRERIDDFLAQQRFAVVGVSRDPDEFSHKIFLEFVRRGYDVVPVNPKAYDIEGCCCYPSVHNIQPPVTAALLLTSPDISNWVVRDCEKAGITRVWLHRGEGVGAYSAEAVDFCEEHGMSVIPGYCPLMFFAETGLIHRVHGLAMKVTGGYPN